MAGPQNETSRFLLKFSPNNHKTYTIIQYDFFEQTYQEEIVLKTLPKINFHLKNPLKFPLKNMSRKKKILLAAAVVIVIAIIAVVIFVTSRRNRAKEAMGTVFTTETATIERQTLSQSISATGTVASAETKTVNTKLSNIEVVAVYVSEGDYVEAGDIICEFDASDYEEELAKAKNNQSINEQIDALGDDYTTIYNEAIAKAEDGLQDVRDTRDEAKEAYIEAMEELASVESDIANAKAAYDEYLANHPTAEADYQSAKAAYEAVQSTYSAYQEAEAALAAATKKLENAESDLADAETKGLDLSSFQQDYNEALHAYDDAEAALSAAQSNYESMNTTVEAAKSAYSEAERIYSKLQTYASAYQSEKAGLSAAEAAVEQTESQYEQAQSQREDYQEQYEDAIDKAKEEYDKAVLEEQLITETQEEKTINEYTELIEDCVVRASISGVITTLNVTEGNIFEGGDIYTIQDNENFIVTSSVDEYDISSIEKGMSAYIKTDATGDVEMTGEVTYVAISSSGTGTMGAAASSGSYTIKVSIDNPDSKLRAGMTAKISIALEESKNTLTVPYDAVTTNPDGTSSITADVDGEKKTITVETGLETDYYTEVISDEVSEGMTVYLTTPMTVTTSGADEQMDFNGGISIFGGDIPSSGGNGGGPGGDNGGGPGGF